MDSIFSDRITDVPRSFIREILKVALDPTFISFAGGLPNRAFFPVEELRDATDRVFDTNGRDVFQYSHSEGYPELRKYISQRYRKKQNLDIPVDNILITSGSQQGLDLLGKTLLNDGDGLIIEEPGYLGAIQAFSLYKPTFLPVSVSEEGMDLQKLRQIIASESPKLMYTVPNFQNPSGISYTEENRRAISEILQGTNTLLIEDDPYVDLRFMGQRKTSFKTLLPDNTILLGSFSKTIVPGFRLGWLVAPSHIMEKIIVAKQATDLHTTHFTQSIIYQYLKNNDIDLHINKIVKAYGNQCQAMLHSIKKYFPKSVKYTKPEGGMFLWVELPQNITSLELFELAVEDKVVFVPRDPFYVNKTGTNTLRLNFSCVDEDTIATGIQRLGNAIEKLMETNG
ncbi:MAG: PLP-dependent aminotransferase family protein [Deltaproteobacteria bacterium]|nr:PLP-dependent aminotransferase family protein [Deltaproteobacteria bacterium]